MNDAVLKIEPRGWRPAFASRSYATVWPWCAWP